MNNLPELEKKIDINFNDKDLLTQVFVHRSYLNENPGFKLDHNERLEFLGDAVLELVVTEDLYRKLPNPEGELTNIRSALVKGKMLSDLASELELNCYLLLSKGEAKSEGKARQIILANAFEALIGAIYLDQGYDVVKKFIANILLKRLKNVIDEKLYMDPKSHLQELSQAELGKTPNYKVLEETGPDHNKVFVVGCFVDDQKISEGTGSSKQAAEASAAAAALESWAEISKKALNNTLS
ncbi:TPA: ribonuclease III [Candidatus Berkelbacteria bacterium]|uniref:Ribonuclease 3 n=1 Tax=Berkelbacteria bacterium GW2011_GWE1_39_12 TaxID=1618337 RepID=A0A0G4B707_9BACT|nr:MAG: putative ribonuclease III [Berkelbacteria bacterium GW2011_GWE1_39_12]HBO60162.1 ribonuclease III [Candidatus Berkelbacteria bacterium]